MGGAGTEETGSKMVEDCESGVLLFRSAEVTPCSFLLSYCSLTCLPNLLYWRKDCMFVVPAKN